MNRPTEPFNPNDREPVSDRSNDPAPSNVWTDAIRELQTMARRHEPQDAPVSAAPASQRPASPPPEPAASAAPQVDETLAALQVLARRYNVEAAQPPSPVADQAPAQPYPGADQIAPEASEFEPSELEPHGEFDDPTPNARMLQRKRPSWASLALILVSAAVLAVLLVGALSLWRQLFHSGDIRTDAPPAASEDVAAPAPATVVAVAPPTVSGAADLGTIEKAMADCDLEAAQNRDALYFLIVPAVSPTKDYTPWTPLSVGDIGTSVILLRSKDALDGLRNGSLAVYSGPYTFSIIDSTTEVAHAWPQATGVAKFTKMDAEAIAGFRVRFGFADFVGDTPSNFRFPRNKGVCYWVSALLRT